MDPYIYVRIVYSLFTIYMIMILLRWLGPWISLDVTEGRFRWIAVITDPLLTRLRPMMPKTGPMDFTPIVAVLLVWFLRTFSAIIVDTMATSGAF